VKSWIADPLFWLIALPALALSGVLCQMILSLFSCCGSFKFQGKPVLLKWWMIPATGTTCALLWTLTALYAFFS
jgi:hypothetical protein